MATQECVPICDRSTTCTKAQVGQDKSRHVAKIYEEQQEEDWTRLVKSAHVKGVYVEKPKERSPRLVK